MQILKLAEAPEELIIQNACAVLKSGGLLIFPTETTYGAGVDATNDQAVEKLLRYKTRREGKPLSIAVTNQQMAEQYAVLNEQARTLYQQFLPGPLTIVSYAQKDVLAPGVVSEFGTIGVRIPDYPLLLKISAAYGKPITATSANGSGEKRPYSLQNIFDHISDKQKTLIDCCIDAGELPHNLPSTVIDTTLSTPVTLRQGKLMSHADAHSQHIITRSESETQELAGKLVLKHWDTLKTTGLVIGLDGPLGAGKTIFSQGVAQFLHIPEQLHSPTYTYYEEYPFDRHGVRGTLVHADFWKVDSLAVFEKLEFATLLQPPCVIVIEWWSQVAEHCIPLLKTAGVPYLQCTIADLGNTRSLSIYEK